MPGSEQKPKSDEELLADAIPIDLDELEELEETTPSGASGELSPISIAADSSDTTTSDEPSARITTFGGPASRHEDRWNRTPNTPGTGAIHVKTFVSKLRLDAVEHMDEQINEWLDAHPQYEVKFVTTSVGKLVGKNIEDALFVNVWV